MEPQQDPEFLNLDLDIESLTDLTPLASFLEGRLFVLYNGGLPNGQHRLSFEVDPRIDLSHSPDCYADYMIDCIQTLPTDLRVLWDGASSRVFDFGFGSGIVPPPYPIEEGRTLNVYRAELHPGLACRLGELNGSIQVTIYPYQPSA